MSARSPQFGVCLSFGCGQSVPHTSRSGATATIALASGVTSEPGTVPRFGELVVTVPVTVSATAAVRQMLGLLEGSTPRELPYVLRGRLSGGPVAGMSVLGGSVSFSAEGSLQLPR